MPLYSIPSDHNFQNQIHHHQSAGKSAGANVEFNTCAAGWQAACGLAGGWLVLPSPTTAAVMPRVSCVMSPVSGDSEVMTHQWERRAHVSGSKRQARQARRQAVRGLAADDDDLPNHSMPSAGKRDISPGREKPKFAGAITLLRHSDPVVARWCEGRVNSTIYIGVGIIIRGEGTLI